MMNEKKWPKKMHADMRALASRKGQGSLEYIMMLSAVSIVIVIALTMVVQLKGAATHSFGLGVDNGIISQLANQLANISST
jgi:hypothetical protein